MGVASPGSSLDSVKSWPSRLANDPMPPNVADTFIMLKPKNEWPDPNRTTESLIAALRAAVTKVPGNNYEFTQPIQMRFNELISGVRSDVAVKIFGDDMDVLNKTAEEVSSMLQKIPSGSEVKVEQTTGLPMLTVNIDRQKAARYGLNVADIQDAVATAIGGVRPVRCSKATVDSTSWFGCRNPCATTSTA